MGHARHSQSTSAAGAAIRSLILPGWGQIAQGRGDIGWPLVFLAAIIAVVSGLWLRRSPSELAALFVDPAGLKRMLALNGAVLMLRLGATVDAWRGGRPGNGRMWIPAILTILAVPHVAIGWAHARTYDVLTTVFTTTTTATTAPMAAPATGGNTSPTSTAPTTTTTTAPTVPFEGRLTVLLMGGDAGPGRTGIRTDTMIVATVDTVSGDVAMFGLPRNLRGLSFSDGTSFGSILNEVYAYGETHPDRFPGANPGAAAVADMATTITGLEIDHFALVDLNAFVDVIDALGGVTMYVPKTVYDPGYPHEDGTEIEMRIEKGVQDLDGSQALAYIRIRYGTSDYDRMGRQRCLLAAVADQIDVPSLVRGLPGLLSAVEENVQTDIPLDRLPALIDVAAVAKATDAIVVGFGPPEWNSGWVEGGWPIPDIPKIQEAVSIVLSDPDGAVERLGLTSAGSACAFGDDSSSPDTTTTITTTTTSPSTTTTDGT